MKNYLTALIAAALIAALIGILSPSGERNGIAKHMKLLSSLFLVCVLIAPLQSAITGLQSLLDGTAEIPNFEYEEKESYQQEMNDALDSASTAYFTQMLTQTLESRFSIDMGEVRCTVEWQTENNSLSPTRVTVILSGKAIWKDPQEIEDFVSELLGCECRSAIE